MAQPGVDQAAHQVMRLAADAIFERHAAAVRAGVSAPQARAMRDDDADLRLAYSRGDPDAWSRYQARQAPAATFQAPAAAPPAGAPLPAGVTRFKLAGAVGPTDAIGTTLAGLTIFRAGTWNGRAYTRADLAAVVRAFREVDFKPALKIGHADDQELAHGFATDLRLGPDGDSLVADFAGVPAETVALIRNGRLVTVSVEFFNDLRRDGKTYKLVLRAVALLGASPPGVAGLPPLANALPVA